MKAIIMAAGKGTRISRHIDGKPKCTVPLGTTTLIETTVALLQKKGIKDIAMTVGYRSNIIRSMFPKNDISFFENPFYHVTNSIASLWFARDYIKPGADYIFLNGDVFCEEALIEKVLAEEQSPVLFADSTRIEYADYKLFYPNGVVEKYGKELLPCETTGEYIGIAKVRSQDIQEFYNKLVSMIFEGKSDLWWENVLYSISDHQPVPVRDLGGLFWAEVDFIEDYERILKYLGLQKQL